MKVNAQAYHTIEGHEHVVLLPNLGTPPILHDPQRIMAQMTNLDALFTAQFQAARKAFEESSDDKYDYEDQLL